MQHRKSIHDTRIQVVVKTISRAPAAAIEASSGYWLDPAFPSRARFFQDDLRLRNLLDNFKPIHHTLNHFVTVIVLCPNQAKMLICQQWDFARLLPNRNSLLVVTGEDIAALGSIGIGVLLMLATIFILVEIKSMMVGESVSPELRD
jgi:hypothetical protein